IMEQQHQETAPPLSYDGETIHPAFSFNYLGNTVCANNNLLCTITDRLHKANDMFHKLRKPWQSKTLHPKVKTRLSQSTVQSSLYYGSSTWPLDHPQLKRKIEHITQCHTRKLKHSNTNIYQPAHEVLIDTHHTLLRQKTHWNRLLVKNTEQN